MSRLTTEQKVEIEELSDEELIRRTESLDNAIRGEYACYGTSELWAEQKCLEELAERGIDLDDD